MATIPDVADNTLILTSWGDAVKDELNLRCLKNNANQTTTGSLTAPNFLLSAAQSASANAVTRRDYVDAAIDARVAVAGDIMTGQLQVGSDPSTWQGSALAPHGPIYSTVVGTSQGSGADGTLTTANVLLRRAGAPASDVNGIFAAFRRSAGGVTADTEIGSVRIASASSVSFNTTSDRRLKQPTGDVADAADIVQALGALAYRGRWIADQGQGEEWVFLNSQDVAPVAPYAVAGAGDAVDGEGNPIPQQLDHGALVPLLCAALSQALGRITALEAAAA